MRVKTKSLDTLSSELREKLEKANFRLKTQKEIIEIIEQEVMPKAEKWANIDKKFLTLADKALRAKYGEEEVERYGGVKEKIGKFYTYFETGWSKSFKIAGRDEFNDITVDIYFGSNDITLDKIKDELSRYKNSELYDVDKVILEFKKVYTGYNEIYDKLLQFCIDNKDVDNCIQSKIREDIKDNYYSYNIWQ